MLRTEFLRLLQPGGLLSENRLAVSLFKSLDSRNFDLKERGADQKEYGWVDIATLSLVDANISQTVDVNDFQDMLFKDVLVKGIKKFPAEDVYYRLAFAEPKSQPVTTVIMGVNGAGKSSFFGALEMIGMGQMNTARLHGMNASQYIKHLFAANNEISIRLNTSSSTIDWRPNEITAFAAPAFFISEWDIRQMEPLEDFGDFIYEQLGLKDFDTLISLLENTRKIIEDNLEAKKRLDSEIDLLSKDINVLYTYFKKVPKKRQGESLTGKEKRVIGKYPGSDTPIDILSSLQTQCIRKEVEKEQNEVYATIDRIGEIEEVRRQLSRLIDILSNHFNSLVSDWTNNYIIPIVKTLLDDYLKDDNVSIEILYMRDRRKIAARLIKEDALSHNSVAAEGVPAQSSVSKTHPRAYFNTFRFKMFAISLKIACACCAKIIHKKNLPIIIDDVFNTSDFNNRQRMGDYINKIYVAYNNKPQLKGYPLQLILFTQDDFIASSVFHGLEETNENVRLLRLHDYNNYSIDRDVVNNKEIDTVFIDVFSVPALHKKS